MKALFTLLFMSLFLAAFAINTYAAENIVENHIAFLDEEEQEETEEEKEDWETDTYEVVNDPLKYYKERYEKDYDVLFEDVFQAVVETITEDLNCMIVTKSTKTDDEGFLKGVIKSDFCVRSVGNDTTFHVMKRYSKNFPIIRGGVWVSGRVQYRFVLKENDDGTASLLMKVELSGREDYVTSKVQFWESNGIIEKQMFDMIDEKLGIEPEEW